MNEKELLAIIVANPWSTVGQIVKLAESTIKGVEPDKFVKSLIKGLRQAGELQTVGKVRGTRYAHKDAPAYVEPELSGALIDRVLALVNDGKSRSAEIEQATGAEIVSVRQALNKLLAEGLIDATGNKKSRRYWPRGKAPAEQAKPAATEIVSVERKPSPKPGSKAWRDGVKRAESNAPRVEPEPEKPQVSPAIAELLPSERPKPTIDILEAARIVLAELPRRTVLANRVERNVFTTGQLAQRLVDRWGFIRYHAGEAIIKAIREGSIVIHHQHRYADGWSVYIWRPEFDTDPAPPERQDPASNTLVTMPEADDAPEPKKRRTRKSAAPAATGTARKGRKKKS